MDKWIHDGREFNTNSFGKVTVLARKGEFAKVRFHNTGTVVDAIMSNVRAGKVSDPFGVTVYGVRYRGRFDKSIKYWKPAYQLWQNMMKRCYSEKDPRGYFGKALVEERWHSFENFLNDLKELEGFDEWEKGSKDSFYRSNLDKDFYVKGNDTYSPSLCRFLPDSFNKSLGKKGKLGTG